MQYTPSHAELAQHPKTRRLARWLGVSIPTTIGHLHLLWHFALKYAPDGDLENFSVDDIEEGCMWEGKPGHLWNGLSAGWIDYDEEADTHRIHDWDEYGGKYIKRREANAERMRETRAKQQPSTKKPRATHVQRTTTARAHLEESREEESRGDKSRGEGVKRAARATPAPDAFPVTDAMREWADEHATGVDIDAETSRFLDRNRANGTTYKDWTAAWRNWMTSPYAKQPARPTSRASPNGQSESRAQARERRMLETIWGKEHGPADVQSQPIEASFRVVGRPHTGTD